LQRTSILSIFPAQPCQHSFICGLV
jgi:hypothetical protein